MSTSFSSYVSIFASAFIQAYEQPEAAAFRARNREAAADLFMTIAAVSYEIMDSLIRYSTARAKTGVTTVYEAASNSYYTKQTVASLEVAYKQWLFIGEYTSAATQIIIECSALIAAFVVATVKVWCENQVEAALIVETTASQEQLVLGGFVPFALLNPTLEVEEVVEPSAPIFTSHKAKAVVKGLGKMNQVKSMLGSSSSSWATLAADLILFATEGGYSTLEEAAASLRQSV
jgi:hypothetical protein